MPPSEKWYTIELNIKKWRGERQRQCKRNVPRLCLTEHTSDALRAHYRNSSQIIHIFLFPETVSNNLATLSVCKKKTATIQCFQTLEASTKKKKTQ